MPKRLALAGLALLGLAGLAWLSFPWWLMLVAQHRMPDGWTLQQLDVQRPGLTELRVSNAVAGTSLAGYDVIATIQAARVSYRQLQVDIEQLEIALQPQATPDDKPLQFPSLNLPQLLLPADLPPILVGALRITGAPGMGVEALELQSLRLGGDQQAPFELNTEVQSLPGLLQPLPLRLSGGDGGLLVELGAQELPLFVELRQTLVDQHPVTRLQARVQLQWLDPEQLQQWFDRPGWPQLQEASGILEASLDSQQLVLRALGAGKLGLSAPPADWPLALRETATAWLDELGVGLDIDPASPLQVTLELEDGAELIAETGAGQHLTFAGDGQLTLEQESSRLHVDFSETDIGLRELDPGSLAGSGRLNWLAGTARPVQLQLDQQSLQLQALETGGTARFQFDQGNLAQATSSGTASLEQLRVPALGVDMNHSDVSWTELDLITLSGKLKLDNRLLTLPLGEDAATPPARFDGLRLDLALRQGSAVNGSGTLQFQPGIELGFALQGDLKNGHFTARLQPTRLAAKSPKAMLTQLGFEWPQLLALTDGSLELSGTLEVGVGTNGLLDISGVDLAATVAKSVLDGLAFELEARLADRVTAAGELGADRFELAAGLDLTELALQLELGEDLVLSNIRGQLLDGGLAISQARISGNQLSPTVLDWAGLDLARLLRFIDVGGLEGSGTVDARLPLESQGSDIAVSGGTFTATGSGYLRYRSGAPATNIGLQALENFQYEELSGTVDYDPAGPYAISVVLLGRNPDLYEGYPIRFRLNIGGELPALFKSLFLTGSFEEALLEQINSGQLAPQP